MDSMLAGTGQHRNNAVRRWVTLGEWFVSVGYQVVRNAPGLTCVNRFKLRFDYSHP